MSNFIYDGSEYIDEGRDIYNAHGEHIMTVTLDWPGEYWIAEANNGAAERVHVNEQDARYTAIEALLASDDC